MTSWAREALSGARWATPFAIPVFVFGLLTVAMHSSADRRERALCDQQVSTLLTTRDLVELERAKFLVRWFNCSISRRIN